MRGLIGIVKHSPGNPDRELFAGLLDAFMLGRPLACERYDSADRRLCAAHLHQAGSPQDSQPARSGDGRWLLFLDGELYNEDLAGEHPAQALLDAYLSEGERLFIRLNGSYAIVILEPETNCLRLICDRSASQPIFYQNTPDYFIFSSRLKPFTRIPHWTPKVRGAALADFLASGYHLRGCSLLEGVTQLGPGQMLTLDAEGASVRHYWSFTLTSHAAVGDDSAYSEELARLLLQSVKRQSRRVDRMGILLSGGYDSRAIAGSMRQLWPGRPLQTITWGEKAKNPDSDAQIAERIAGHIGAQHTFFELDGSALSEHFRDYVKLDEGRTDAVGNYPEALRIFERIRDELGIEVLLRGDECFGWKEEVRRRADMLHSLEIHELAKLSNSYGYLETSARKALIDSNQQHLERLLAGCPYTGLHDRKDYLYFTQRLRGYLNPLSQLKQVVLEVRNPFLDNEILDFIGLLPIKLRLGKALFKTTVQRMFPEFEAYGFAKHSSLIDWDERLGSDPQLQAFIRRTLLDHQNGFDDLLDRRRLRAFIERALADAATQHRAEIHRQRVWSKVKRRLLRRQGYFDLPMRTQIFRLMILKLWADEYLGGQFEISWEVN